MPEFPIPGRVTIVAKVYSITPAPLLPLQVSADPAPQGLSKKDDSAVYQWTFTNPNPDPVTLRLIAPVYSGVLDGMLSAVLTTDPAMGMDRTVEIGGNAAVAITLTVTATADLPAPGPGEANTTISVELESVLA